MKKRRYPYRKKDLLYKELDFPEENRAEYWREGKDWFWEDLSDKEQKRNRENILGLG